MPGPARSRPTGQQRLEARRARLERHASETDQGVVINAAARFLEQRSRSVHEVRRHLQEAKYPEPLIEGAVSRLVEIGVLNDDLFARAWVESRDRARPRGTSALRRELALKGIDRELIAEILAGRREIPEWTDDRDEPETTSADERAAELLLRKSGSSLSRVTDPRLRRQRAYALLARKGFDPEICRQVSARVLDARERGDETAPDE